MNKTKNQSRLQKLGMQRLINARMHVILHSGNHKIFSFTENGCVKILMDALPDPKSLFYKLIDETGTLSGASGGVYIFYL